jgi:hypothetical protein
MSTIFENFFSNLPDIRWGIQKGINSYQSGEIYALIPAGAAAYCAYKALGHLSHALIGSDSLSFRKKFITSSFSDRNLPISSRISKFTQTFFGSSSLHNRFKRIRNGLGWGALGASLLYSLHAYTKKEVELDFPGKSPDLDEMSRELCPDCHAYDTKSQALSFFQHNKDYLNHSLSSYFRPEDGYNATEEQQNFALKLSDFIFDTSKKTPVTSFLQKNLGGTFSWIQEKFCETTSSINSTFNSFFNATSLCDRTSTSPSVEKMSPEELNQAYESVKDLIIKQAPQDYEGQVAQRVVSFCKRLLDWVPGVDAELRCSGLERGIHPIETNQTLKDLSNLDALYQIIKADGLRYRELTALSDHNFMSGPPEEMILDGTLKILNNFTKEGSQASVPIKLIKRTVTKLFDLSENFNETEFKRGFHNFSKSYHPDKCNTNKAICQEIQTVTNALNEVVKMYSSTICGPDNGQIPEVRSNALPNPLSVISDLYTSFISWYERPLK